MSATDPRIAVVGAGAVGGWIVARLAASGSAVNLLARGATLQAIRRDGLHLTEAGNTTALRINVSDAAADFGPQDVLILAVKAPALAQAADAARPMLGDQTLILPMLNGVPWWFVEHARLTSVDPDGSVAAAFPLAQVMGCVVHAACSRSAPNQVTVAHADKLIIGEPAGGHSERARMLAELFMAAGIRTEVSADIRSAIWYKLWGNATINPLSALTRATADRLLGDPALHAFMSEAMAELAAVGTAIDCPINESSADRMAVTARLGTFKPSMLQDVEAGRPLELEALVGAPIEIARRVGVATPALDRIYAMTRLMGEALNLL